MITIGLDFGTHQTKLCVKSEEGVELNYYFWKFKDNCGNFKYTIPSIIKVKEDGRLSYGYISPDDRGCIIRYFKQGAFQIDKGFNFNRKDAILFSVWYIAYILFDLEIKYSNNFNVQMGVPSDADASHLQSQKETAVVILASAYNLVEDVYHKDKDAFLEADYCELKKITKLLCYNEGFKELYQILVFPEAYACLMLLTASRRISRVGMNLMVDIGGGTTDYSLFTIEHDKPQVYYFKSVNKGLNFLTEAGDNMINTRTDSNVNDESEILNDRFQQYKDEIERDISSLLLLLKCQYRIQTTLPLDRLEEALKDRPIIYTGGGSTFNILRCPFKCFKEVVPITTDEWRRNNILDIENIVNQGLVPILSTAYGLTIDAVNDEIVCQPFRDIFDNLRTYNATINIDTPPDRGDHDD